MLTEDQGAHLSLIGTPGLKTPHMDELAKSGVYFSNAFVVYPVCSASKAAFYTGLHSHTNGILNNTHNFHKPAEQVTPAEKNLELARKNRVRDEFRTLTEILRSHGYYQGVTHSCMCCRTRSSRMTNSCGARGPKLQVSSKTPRNANSPGS